MGVIVRNQIHTEEKHQGEQIIDTKGKRKRNPTMQIWVKGSCILPFILLPKWSLMKDKIQQIQVAFIFYYLNKSHSCLPNKSIHLL